MHAKTPKARSPPRKAAEQQENRQRLIGPHRFQRSERSQRSLPLGIAHQRCATKAHALIIPHNLVPQSYTGVQNREKPIIFCTNHAPVRDTCTSLACAHTKSTLSSPVAWQTVVDETEGAFGQDATSRRSRSRHRLLQGCDQDVPSSPQSPQDLFSLSLTEAQEANCSLLAFWLFISRARWLDARPFPNVFSSRWRNTQKSEAKTTPQKCPESRSTHHRPSTKPLVHSVGERVSLVNDRLLRASQLNQCKIDRFSSFAGPLSCP